MCILPCHICLISDMTNNHRIPVQTDMSLLLVRLTKANINIVIDDIVSFAIYYMSAVLLRSQIL